MEMGTSNMAGGQESEKETQAVLTVGELTALKSRAI